MLYETMPDVCRWRIVTHRSLAVGQVGGVVVRC